MSGKEDACAQGNDALCKIVLLHLKGGYWSLWIHSGSCWNSSRVPLAGTAEIVDSPWAPVQQLDPWESSKYHLSSLFFSLDFPPTFREQKRRCGEEALPVVLLSAGSISTKCSLSTPVKIKIVRVENYCNDGKLLSDLVVGYIFHPLLSWL